MDACFGRSPPHSIGIEEEFQLLDAETLALVSRIDRILSRAPQGYAIKAEALQSAVEATTLPARTVEQAVEELARLRRELARLARDAGACIAAAGTHPFSRYEDQDTTEAYRDRPFQAGPRPSFGLAAVFGLHVHVAVDSAETAIGCVNALRLVVPELLAVSTNSPFYDGRRSGLASTRAQVLRNVPHAGLPPPLASFSDFERVVARGVASGMLADYTKLWWDVRPHPRLGTVEVRICDAQTRLESVAGLAALVQSLVATLAAAVERAPAGARPDAFGPELTEIVEENRWRAARDGLAATLIDPTSDSERSVRESVSGLLDACATAGTRLGCASELDRLGNILTRGTGADEQLRIHDETHSLRAVTRWLADRTVEVG